MRTLTKLAAGAAVVLALAGCTSGPSSAASDSKVSAGGHEASAGGSKNLPVQSSNKQLLAEEGGYKFYSLVPVAGSSESSGGSLCVIIASTTEIGTEAGGCSGPTPYVAIELDGPDDLLEAKLVFTGYNAGKELAEGWRHLHPNLLVRGQDDPQPRMAVLDAPEEPADALTVDAKYLFGVKADSARLLAKDDDRAFYAAIPNDPDKGDICLVVENLTADTASAGCGRVPSVELDAAGVKAKLVVDDYDAGQELAEGWLQPHQNLLVYP